MLIHKHKHDYLTPTGRTFTSTYSTTPALLLAPAPLLAKQWKKQFDRDYYLSPLFAVLGVPVLGWLCHRGALCIYFSPDR